MVMVDITDPTLQLEFMNKISEHDKTQFPQSELQDVQVCQV